MKKLIIFALVLVCSISFAAQLGNPGALARTSKVASGSSFDVDAQDYFNRIVVNGSTISASQKTAVNTFVLAAKANGYWANLIDVNPFGGTSLVGGTTKLKAYSGAPTTNANHSFAGGSYSETLGFTGDGTAYLGTGVNVNNIGATIGISFFLNQDVTTSTSGVFIGDTFDFSADQRSIAFFSGIFYVDNAFNPFGGNVWSYAPGLYHVLRGHSSTNTFFINGQVVGVGSTASSSAKTDEITVFAAGGSFQGAYVGAFYALDDGLMGMTKAQLFGNDVRNLVYDMGRRSPISTIDFVPWYGQSLSIGYLASPATSLTASTKTNRVPTIGPAGLVTDHSVVVQGNMVLARELAGGVETPVSGFLSSITNTFSATYGYGGYGYAALARGTAPYTFLTQQVALAYSQNRDYANNWNLRALMMVHGENDQTNLDYATNLLIWRTNLQSDLGAVSAASNPLKMYHSQIASWSENTYTTAFSNHTSSLLMIEAAKRDSNHKVIMPKYFLDYVADGTHLTNSGSQLMGQYYAKAYAQEFSGGSQWVNFYPTNIARTLAAVTLTFPRLGLVLDTNAVAKAKGYGFEWFDDAGPSVSILEATVALSGANTNVVTFTLSATPSGSNFRVRYAYTATNLVGATAGASKINGPRGNIRNNDTLPDWCLIFDEVSP